MSKRTKSTHMRRIAAIAHEAGIRTDAAAESLARAVAAVLDENYERIVAVRPLKTSEIVPRALPYIDADRVGREVFGLPAGSFASEHATYRAVKQQLVAAGFLEY